MINRKKEFSYSYLRAVGQEALFRRLDQRIRPIVTFPPEIVVVDRPEHYSTQLLLVRVSRFQPHYILVVVTYPLILFERVWAHRVRIRLDHFPVVRLRQALANLR